MPLNINPPELNSQADAYIGEIAQSRMYRQDADNKIKTAQESFAGYQAELSKIKNELCELYVKLYQAHGVGVIHIS